MTDQELDRLMQRVLLDFIALDCGSEETASTVFEPSQQHRRQMRSMLKDPLGWMRRKSKPIWKLALQRVAVVLLIASLSLGGLMAVSPTVRATVIRWVTEWYETYVVYRYSGDTISEEMPKYEITELPDGYIEAEDERIEEINYVQITYRNESDPAAQTIYFDYIYMQEGTAHSFATDNAASKSVIINGMEGIMFVSDDQENERSTITWIDPVHNLHFTLDAALNELDILHMAESISLVTITNN